MQIFTPFKSVPSCCSSHITSLWFGLDQLCTSLYNFPLFLFQKMLMFLSGFLGPVSEQQFSSPVTHSDIILYVWIDLATSVHKYCGFEAFYNRLQWSMSTACCCHHQAVQWELCPPHPTVSLLSLSHRHSVSEDGLGRFTAVPYSISLFGEWPNCTLWDIQWLNSDFLVSFHRLVILENFDRFLFNFCNLTQICSEFSLSSWCHYTQERE